MSALNKVLANQSAKIIFEDFLECPPQLFCVSRAVNDVCKKARAERFPTAVELRHPDFIAATKKEVERICGEEPLETVLENLMNELVQKIPEIDRSSRRSSSYAPMSMDAWNRIQEVYANLSKEEDPEKRQNRAERLLVCLNRANKLLQDLEVHGAAYSAAQEKWNEAHNRDMQQVHDVAHIANLARDNNTTTSQEIQRIFAEAGQSAAEYRDLTFECLGRSLTALPNHFRQFLAQENLAKRAQTLISQQANPQLPLALHESQNAFNMTRAQRQQFEREAQRPERAQDGLSRAQLLAREVRGIDGELASDGALAHYWRVSLRNALIGQAQVDPNTVPPADAPVFRIRAWLTSNQAALAQFTHWDIPLTPECPLLFSWIGLFTGLRSLRVVGSEAHRLVTLPPELAQLEHLESLVLEGHSFREIPPILQGLPALNDLSIERNEHPIRVFPEWLDAKINGGFFRGLDLAMENTMGVQMARMDQFFGLGILGERSISGPDMIRNWNRQYAGLPHQDFSDVPFNFWFRENFSIPNIACYMSAGLMEFGLRLVNIGQFYRQGWLGMIQALTFPLLPVTAVFGLIIASVFWAPALVTWSLLTAFQISSLSFLIEPILHFVIGPRIEACLDEDDPMIHVRDFPEEPAAGAQV